MLLGARGDEMDGAPDFENSVDTTMLEAPLVEDPPPLTDPSCEAKQHNR